MKTFRKGYKSVHMLRWLRKTALLSLLLLGGCIASMPPAQPMRSYSVDTIIYETQFDTAGDWQRYALQGVSGDVRDGAYRLNISIRNYVWVQNRTRHEDVLIEGDAYLLSDYDKGIYGLMCRGQGAENSRGYYFLIAADGSFSIRRGAGNAVDALVPWQRSSAIRTGKGRNRLSVICVQDYLAFYVNDEFLADIRDTRYSDGYAGIVAGLPPQSGEEDVVDLSVDSLRIWTAR